MLHQFSKSFLAVISLSIALTVAACGTGEAEEDIEPISSTEAQTAPETEIIDEPAPTPTPLPTPTDLPTEITEPVSPIQPVSPLKEPAMAPSNSEIQVLPGSEAVLAAAVADLSGIPASEISLVSMEAVDWSDASLGCPQEGYMYAQVITPGFLIVLEAQSQPYEYHTDRTGNVVLCEA